MVTKPGASRIGVDFLTTYTEHPVTGNVATDSIQYSSVATIGTTAVEVWNALIDNGVPMKLKELEVGFTQKFTGIDAALAGSISYYWRARSETRIPSAGFNVAYTSTYATISAVFAKLVGTGLAYEDTFEGYVDVSKVPYSPVRVSLMATGLAAANVEGKIKNTTFVRLVGNVIPGT